MFSLEDRGVSPFRQIATILTEIDSVLACYPNLNMTSNKVKYFDYQSQNRDWLHIACIFDSNIGLMRGQLLMENEEFIYFQDIP
jgi:hypothetical protein